MRAVPIVVSVVVKDKVPARHVVDEPVAIVVDAIPGDFPAVDPDVGRKVRVRGIDTAVYDGDGDAAASCHIPRLLGANTFSAMLTLASSATPSRRLSFAFDFTRLFTFFRNVALKRENNLRCFFTLCRLVELRDLVLNLFFSCLCPVRVGRR